MLRTQYVRIRHLRIFEILRMHEIFERYYDHGPIDIFLNDLHKKDGVFLVRRERDDQIVGFSTLVCSAATPSSRRNTGARARCKAPSRASCWSRP